MTTPTLPFPKLNQILVFLIRVGQKSTADRIAAYAAQAAFFILLSVFPFAMFLLQMMRFLPISQESLLFTVDTIFPEYLLPTLHEILQEIYSSAPNLVTITIVTTLWAASNANYAVAAGLDRIVNAEEMRSLLVIRLWSLVYTIIMTVLILFAVGSTVYWQSFRSMLIHSRPHGLSLSAYSSIIRAVYSIVQLSIGFALMYKFYPHKKLRFVAQLPGAVTAAIGWYLSSALISLYITNFNAASMYGSLTTLTLVMFWLYFCNYFIMLGAVINEVLRLHPRTVTPPES